VPFLSTDSNYTSTGVIKMANAKPKQLGLFGVFLPTEGTDPATGSQVSVFPDDQNPKLQVYAFTGDLGLDDGVAQSVYVLDQSKLSQVKNADGTQFTKMIGVGDTVKLPGGNGTVTFDGVKRYVALDVRYDPTKTYVLVFALMALFGVTSSLFIRRRRVWFRAVPADDRSDGTTVVSIGGLSRTEDMQLAAEVRGLLMAAVPDRVELTPAAGTPATETSKIDKPAEDAGEGV
jgi:cytochrome c biogenesis protein